MTGKPAKATRACILVLLALALTATALKLWRCNRTDALSNGTSRPSGLWCRGPTSEAHDTGGAAVDRFRIQGACGSDRQWPPTDPWRGEETCLRMRLLPAIENDRDVRAWADQLPTDEKVVLARRCNEQMAVYVIEQETGSFYQLRLLDLGDGSLQGSIDLGLLPISDLLCLDLDGDRTREVLALGHGANTHLILFMKPAEGGTIAPAEPLAVRPGLFLLLPGPAVGAEWRFVDLDADGDYECIQTLSREWLAPKRAEMLTEYLGDARRVEIMYELQDGAYRVADVCRSDASDARGSQGHAGG